MRTLRNPNPGTFPAPTPIPIRRPTSTLPPIAEGMPVVSFKKAAQHFAEMLDMSFSRALFKTYKDEGRFIEGIHFCYVGKRSLRFYLPNCEITLRGL